MGMQVRAARSRRGLFLASSSFVALLAGGGVPVAYAANPCQINETGPGSTTTISNASGGNVTCINVQSGFTVTGNISNAGIIDAIGIAAPTQTGITISSATVGGTITNSGTIAANATTGVGIRVTGDSTITSGITNSGSISAGTFGIFVQSQSFVGGVSNSGTIHSAGQAGILVSQVTNFSGGISNGSSGTISAVNAAIWVNAVSTFSGGITNSGTLTMRGEGITVQSVGSFDGGISNAGTITGGAYGMGIANVNTFSGGLTNSGEIIARLNGINLAEDASIVGNISNSGTISAVAAGLYLLDSQLTGNIVNSQRITAATGVSMAGATINGGIVDTGTIAATAHGILIDNVSKIAAGTGTAIAISGATFTGGIANSGTIDGKTGIVVTSGVSTFSGTISNSGSISASGGIAIDVSGANNAITIAQAGGTIIGAIKLSTHADVLDISGGTIAGNIVGQGASNTINFTLGSGTFTYGAAYGFSGINQVNINSGIVVLDGTNNATAVDVIGGTLEGTGTLDPLTMTVHSGATFSPGTPGSPGTSMTITGSLAFQSGALYVVYLNPTTSSFANVSGTASLAGTVTANFATGAYIAKQYVILESGGISGTFSNLTTINLPAHLAASLSYTNDDVLLTLTGTLPTQGLNNNKRDVGNALDAYFNSGGTLPPSALTLFGLSGDALDTALTHLDGEAATDAGKGANQLMNDFLELMLDPTAGGGGNIGGGAANGFAPEQDTSLPPDVALAYAKALKQAPDQSSGGLGRGTFDQRWTAWGSAFGGASHTDGDPNIGSNDVIASDFGFAAGMEYHATPNFSYGFGLAGGGTNWNLAQGLGSGRSDSFQAGVYAKTHAGPAYFSAALAFANHWFTTSRTAAFGDQLQANFMGQSYAARGEVGYRYGLPVTGYIVGVTPYAALQVQDFHTPSYSETDLTGGGFGLSYASESATDTRSELGARFDNLQVIDGIPLVLRGRLAWAHDWMSNSSLGAAFEALPGSNFTVNGAAQPKNSALTTAAAELHLTANWTAIAKFDGEFGSDSQTYGGTGTLRYSW